MIVNFIVIQIPLLNQTHTHTESHLQTKHPPKISQNQLIPFLFVLVVRQLCVYGVLFHNQNWAQFNSISLLGLCLHGQYGLSLGFRFKEDKNNIVYFFTSSFLILPFIFLLSFDTIVNKSNMLLMWLQLIKRNFHVAVLATSTD